MTTTPQTHLNFDKEIDAVKYFYENIIAHVHGNIFWKDRHCILQGCNDQQAKILGFKSRDEIPGKSNYDMIVRFTSEQDRVQQAEEITRIDEEVMRTEKSSVAEEPLFLPHAGNSGPRQ